MVARLLRATALASLLLFAAAGVGKQASADNTEAVLRCATDQVTPTTGSQVNVACSLIDNVGAPLGDTDVTFYVRTENRSDANWDNGGKVAIIKTDARGQVKATLNAGPKVGNLGLLVNYPGIFSYYTFVNVVAGSGTPTANTTTASTTTTTSSASTSSSSDTTGQSSSSSTTPPTSTYLPQMGDGEGAPD